MVDHVGWFTWYSQIQAKPMVVCLIEAKSRGPVVVVKKLLLLGAVAVGGFLVYRQVQDNKDKAEKDLWTEVTDPVPVPAKG
jgi:hypothetical protein